MALKTRKPTGKTPPPVVLLEGDEGAGKSWAAAVFSGSDQVGFTAWLQVGTESTGDYYGQVPGARYELIEHDGTWHTIYAQVADAKKEAENARTRGDKPFVLVIDQIGGIWDLLSEWAYNRAASSGKNKELLAADPNAEIDITTNYWNDAKARWRKLMRLLLTFPGIVVILARGSETTAFENGKPNPKKRDYRVEGEKSLKFDVPAWVRMTRDGVPTCVKLRSVANPIQISDRNRPIPNFSLEKFVFDLMGYDPATSDDAAGMVAMVAGSDAPPSEMATVIQFAIDSAESFEHLAGAFRKIKPALEREEISAHEAAALERAANARRPEFPRPTVPAAEGSVNGSVAAVSG